MTTTLDNNVVDARDEQDRAWLKKIVERIGTLLPMPGPITAFAFLNTLQSLEDMPFDEGMRAGARLYNAQPYLPEDVYREKLAEGRILPADLEAVLRESAGDEEDEVVFSLATRFQLHETMLKNPVRLGQPEELRWFVAETDALRRLRGDVPIELRKQFVEDTRRWVMRDVRGGGAASSRHDSRSAKVLEDLIVKFGAGNIENWSAENWEALSLHALWRICRDGVHGVGVQPLNVQTLPRPRDVLREATGEDADTMVNEVLIRYCAAFTDQGLAPWPLPGREFGFFAAFCELYCQSMGPPQRWMAELPGELERIRKAGLSPIESIFESLALLGIKQSERDDFLTGTLFSLRGWAGMIWHMETRSDRVPLPVQPGTLLEFLAVRLILDRLAAAYVAKKELGFQRPLDELHAFATEHISERRANNVDQRAFLVFQIAQLLCWSPPELFRIPKHEWANLVHAIEAFNGLERRWVFHQAFERRLRIRVLDAFTVRTSLPPRQVEKPRFQAVFCIDAREESFRRYIEASSPDVETFGAPGFYGVAMYYRGAADAHYSALCPIVVFPQVWMTEDVVLQFEETHRRRAKTRRAIGAATHQVHLGSRGLAGGALITASLGVLASIPLVARVLSPRFVARVRRTAGRFVQPPPVTRLRLKRIADKAGMTEDAIGLSALEMANIGERMLRDIGLTRNFARLVIFFGHGSFCLNNPHRSAYDCGACSGNAGGPNARALAAILNDRHVRETLAARGLIIPPDTVFLGGMHNTCVDSLTFADLDLVPQSHMNDFTAAKATLEKACPVNAHERCRRFQSAPLDLSYYDAHRHVEGRSEDLAQTRPEFGNASNAICYVGRRSRIAGLFMDRRMFMNSYDPTQDDANGTILARILAAAVPVCEGINMQYYLSYVDSPGWACGTKLPHNVTSLLGVMDGAASDLRPGLPWQSVEIHEPVRLLFVIESTPEIMSGIMDRNETIGRILRNGWAHLAVIDPHSSKIQLLQNRKFVPFEPEEERLPEAACSLDWYRGWREHLGFALVDNIVKQPDVAPGRTAT